MFVDLDLPTEVEQEKVDAVLLQQERLEHLQDQLAAAGLEARRKKRRNDEEALLVLMT